MAGGVRIDWGEESDERRRLVDAEAQRIAGALGAMGAELVVMFGSRARGQAGSASDLDLLAVMPCDPSWTFARRLAEIGTRVDPRVATDLLVYTPDEFVRLRRESRFVRQALAEGIVLHGIPGTSPRQS